MAQWTAATPAPSVESARIRRILTAVPKYCGSRPGARTRMSQGAASTTLSEISENTQTKARVSLRNKAVRSAPCAAVSRGTKAKMMLLISTELSMSRGPMATASESALLCVPSRYAISATRPTPSTLPVRTPATIVKPPRSRGLSTARVIARSGLTAADDSVEFSPDLKRRGRASRPRGAITCRLRRWGARASGRRQRGFVVREIGYFLDVLGMANLVVRVQHENRPALNSQFLDQSSVICAEGRIFVVGEHFQVIHGEGGAPAFLGERQVHAHRDYVHPRQVGRCLVETLGLRIANRRIERRYHADDAHPVAGVFQGDGLESPIHQAEIRSRIAHLEFGPHQRQGGALHRRCSCSFHISPYVFGDFNIVSTRRTEPARRLATGRCSCGKRRRARLPPTGPWTRWRGCRRRARAASPPNPPAAPRGWAQSGRAAP